MQCPLAIKTVLTSCCCKYWIQIALNMRQKWYVGSFYACAVSWCDGLTPFHAKNFMESCLSILVRILVYRYHLRSLQNALFHIWQNLVQSLKRKSTAQAIQSFRHAVSFKPFPLWPPTDQTTKKCGISLMMKKSKELTVYAHKLRQNKRMHHGCSDRDTSFHRTAGMVTHEQPIGQQLADREKKLSISGEWLSYYTDSMQASILCHSKKINDGIYALWCCIIWRLMTEISPSALHWASIVNSLIWG